MAVLGGDRRALLSFTQRRAGPASPASSFFAALPPSRSRETKSESLTRTPRSAILLRKGFTRMATRAPRAEPADWRAAFRRSAARALQLTGAVALYFATGFLLLALV